VLIGASWVQKVTHVWLVQCCCKTTHTDRYTVRRIVVIGLYRIVLANVVGRVVGVDDAVLSMHQ